MDNASTARTSLESLRRSTCTSIPGSNTASTVLLAMAGNTLPKQSLVPLADLGLHGTADRADFTGIHQRPLREAMEVWADDDLPRRRGKDVRR